jgi:neurofibromin 1
LPPGLDDDVCKNLYGVLVYFLTSRQLPFFHGELQEAASRCLYQLSASNYETIIPNMVAAIGQATVEEDVIMHINLLETLNTNRKQLAELFKRLEKIIVNTKKSPVLICFARVLRKIIWNWIDRYPIEFVNLCKSESKLEGKRKIHFF